MTRNKLIYFAGSIRGGRDDKMLYIEIVDQLRGFGSVLTEHVGDESLGDDERLSDREIYNRDIAWLRSADCLIAEVTTPSLGVGFEIAKAIEWGKPVLCLFRSDHGRLLSAMIAGCTDVTHKEYSVASDLVKILGSFMRVV